MATESFLKTINLNDEQTNLFMKAICKSKKVDIKSKHKIKEIKSKDEINDLLKSCLTLEK